MTPSCWEPASRSASSVDCSQWTVSRWCGRFAATATRSWLSSPGALLAQVLHIDRNDYYGGASASLNLNQVRSVLLRHPSRLASCIKFTCKAALMRLHRSPGQPGLTACVLRQLYGRFHAGQTPPKALGPSRDYNVDMVPKFILSGGELVRAPGISIRRGSDTWCTGRAHWSVGVPRICTRPCHRPPRCRAGSRAPAPSTTRRPPHVLARAPGAARRAVRRCACWCTQTW